jgi:hypothetical protein
MLSDLLSIREKKENKEKGSHNAKRIGIYDLMHSHELFSVCGVLRYLWYLSAVIFTFEDWDNGGGCKLNGRTIPSFRIALAMEKEEWKSFRNALDKSDRKKFDEMMFDIPRF